MVWCGGGIQSLPEDSLSGLAGLQPRGDLKVVGISMDFFRVGMVVMRLGVRAYSLSAENSFFIIK